jgi:hypothetical protein
VRTIVDVETGEVEEAPTDEIPDRSDPPDEAPGPNGEVVTWHGASCPARRLRAAQSSAVVGGRWPQELGLVISVTIQEASSTRRPPQPNSTSKPDGEVL